MRKFMKRPPHMGQNPRVFCWRNYAVGSSVLEKHIDLNISTEMNESIDLNISNKMNKSIDLKISNEMKTSIDLNISSDMIKSIDSATPSDSNKTKESNISKEFINTKESSLSGELIRASNFRVGDWIEAKAKKDFNAGLVLSVDYDSRTSVTILKANGSISMALVSNIVYRIPKWSLIESGFEEAAKMYENKIPIKAPLQAKQVIEHELKCDPKQVMIKLGYMKTCSQQKIALFKNEMNQLHAKCRLAIDNAVKGDCLNGKMYHQTLVGLDDLVDCVFYDAVLSVDAKYDAVDYAIKLTSSRSKSEQAQNGAVETYAVYSYLLKNGFYSFEPYMQKPSDICKLKMFTVMTPLEIEKLQWMHLQHRALHKSDSSYERQQQMLCKSLNLHYYKPGVPLEAFIKKIAYQYTHVHHLDKTHGRNAESADYPQAHIAASQVSMADAQVSFTSSDLIFIEALQKAACSYASVANGYTRFYAEALNPRLVAQGILKYAEKSIASPECTFLLKLLGVWTASQFCTTEQILHTAIVEVAPGPSQPPWINEANENAIMWADSILKRSAGSEEKKETGNGGNPMNETGNGENPISEEYFLKSHSIENDAFLQSRLKHNLVFPSLKESDAALDEACASHTEGSAVLPSSDNPGSPVDGLCHLRRDIYETVYAIDDQFANEIDDGISIEPIEDLAGNKDYWVHVHIADPTSLIGPNHPLAMYAQLRGSSVYFEEKSFAMLPSDLAKTKLGLDSNRPALTFSARISTENGDVIDYKVTPTFLKCVKAIDYDSADIVLGTCLLDSLSKTEMLPSTRHSYSRKQKAITNGHSSLPNSLDSSQINELNLLFSIAEKHAKFRLRRGALKIESLAARIRVSYDSNDRLKQRSPTVFLDPFRSSLCSASRYLVEECMIIAGRVAARFCLDHKVTVPFRGQASFCESTPGISSASFSSFSSQNSSFSSSQTSLNSVIESVKEATIANGFTKYFDYSRLLPFMKSSSLSLNPAAHASLGISGASALANKSFSLQNNSQMIGYVQVTSPLRRYLDLLSHWQIKAALLRNRTSRPCFSFAEPDFHRILARQSRLYKRSRMISMRSTEAWVAEWCRRREMLHAALHVDPITDRRGSDLNGLGFGLRDPNPVLGAKYLGEDFLWGKKSGLDAHRPVYECTIIDVGCVVTRKSPRCIVTELGGLVGQITVGAQFLNSFALGNVIKCTVLVANPNCNFLLLRPVHL